MLGQATPSAIGPRQSGRRVIEDGLGKPRSVPSFVEKGLVVMVLLLSSNAVITLVRQADPGFASADVATEDPLLRILFGATYGLTIMALPIVGKGLLRKARREPLLLFLLFLSVLSIAWSGTPALSGRRALALLGTSLFGLYVATRFSLNKIVEMVFWALAAAMALSMIFIIALPQYGIATGPGIAPGWRGIFIHKNQLGRLAVLSLMTAALVSSGSASNKAIRLLVGSLSLALVLGSGSITAIVVASLLLVVPPFIKVVRLNRVSAIPILIFGAFVLGLLLTTLVENREGLLSTNGRDSGLTGRTQLWSDVREDVQRHPVLGYGYSAFWLGSEGPSSQLWVMNPWRPNHAHNGWLDLALDLGLVGVGLFGLLCARSLVRALRLARRAFTSAEVWPFAYLMFVVFYTATESIVLKANTIFWILFVAAVTYSGTSADGEARSSFPVERR